MKGPSGERLMVAEMSPHSLVGDSHFSQDGGWYDSPTVSVSMEWAGESLPGFVGAALCPFACLLDLVL